MAIRKPISNLTGTLTELPSGDGVGADYVAFTPSAAHTPLEGEAAWNQDEGTVSIGLNGGAVEYYTGQQTLYRVINQSGSAITKGTLCMYAGTVGSSGKLKVVPWDGNSDSVLIMGIALADIETENDPIEAGLGYVVGFGKVQGVNTTGSPYGETWASGDVLYAGTSGGLTKTKPAAPETKTIVASVVNSHATVGELLVRVSLASNLSNDDLVELSTLASGQVLSYDTNRFVNKSLNDAGIVGITTTQTLSAKTITNLVFDGDYTEEVFTISDGGSVDLDPSSGTIQLWTLGASRTPTATGFADGQSMTLMIDDGTAYAITWPSVTWKTDGGVAPTLNTSGFTVVQLWKVSSVLYGARVGDA
jgi:hypothetical protein